MKGSRIPCKTVKHIWKAYPDWPHYRELLELVIFNGTKRLRLSPRFTTLCRDLQGHILRCQGQIGDTSNDQHKHVLAEEVYEQNRQEMEVKPLVSSKGEDYRNAGYTLNMEEAQLLTKLLSVGSYLERGTAGDGNAAPQHQKVDSTAELPSLAHTSQAAAPRELEVMELKDSRSQPNTSAVAPLPKIALEDGDLVDLDSNHSHLWVRDSALPTRPSNISQTSNLSWESNLSQESKPSEVSKLSRASRTSQLSQLSQSSQLSQLSQYTPIAPHSALLNDDPGGFYDCKPEITKKNKICQNSTQVCAKCVSTERKWLGMKQVPYMAVKLRWRTCAGHASLTALQLHAALEMHAEVTELRLLANSQAIAIFPDYASACLVVGLKSIKLVDSKGTQRSITPGFYHNIYNRNIRMQDCGCWLREKKQGHYTTHRIY